MDPGRTTVRDLWPHWGATVDLQPLIVLQADRPSAWAPPAPTQVPLWYHRPLVQHERPLLGHLCDCRPLIECWRQQTLLDLQMLPGVSRDSPSTLNEPPPPGHQGAQRVPTQQSWQAVNGGVAEGHRGGGAAVRQDTAALASGRAAANLKGIAVRPEGPPGLSIPLDDGDAAAVAAAWSPELPQAGASTVACVAQDPPDQVLAADPSTPPPPGAAAATQTEGPQTADGQMNTEVHVADLDHLAEEFIKLKEQNRKLRSSVKCCTERARQAELRLLALQYASCTQHCYRLFYTSSEGSLLGPAQEHADVLQRVLRDLQADFEELRRRILAGVPLQQLPPLSVRSERLAAGARYAPAQMVADVLGASPSRKSVEPRRHKASWEQGGHGEEGQSGGDGQAAEGGDGRAEGDGRTGRDAKPPAAGEDVCGSEAWYDAEEDLQPASRGEGGVGRRPQHQLPRGREETDGGRPGPAAHRPERPADGVRAP